MATAHDDNGLWADGTSASFARFVCNAMGQYFDYLQLLPSEVRKAGILAQIQSECKYSTVAPPRSELRCRFESFA